MKVLLDECLPRRLKHDLPGHIVHTVPEMGWNGLKDTPLLRKAEQGGIDVLVTIDGNLTYQQNLRSTALGFVVFQAHNNTYDTLHPLMPKVAAVLPNVTTGTVTYITS